jgi:hypothetical protein
MKITPHYQTLIVCCRDCQLAGDPNPPALARFAQNPDGSIDLEASTLNRAVTRGPLYPWMLPVRHERSDGGVTWRLPRCPYGHNRPVRHERLVAAFEEFPAGRNDIRVCL